MPPAHLIREKPEINPCLIAVAVILATFMEVLDTSIAAVALPYIAGVLSATNDEATWVLTVRKSPISEGVDTRVVLQVQRECDHQPKAQRTAGTRPVL